MPNRGVPCYRRCRGTPGEASAIRDGVRLRRLALKGLAMMAARKQDWKARMASASEAVPLPKEDERRSRKHPTSTQLAAERSLPKEARAHARYLREDFTERLSTGAAESASRMRRVAPCRALERVARKVGPDLMAGAQRHHVTILAVEGVGTGKIRERVQSSAAPATVQDMLVDAVDRLAKAKRALDRVEDEAPKLLDADPTLNELCDEVFRHRANESFKAIYGNGRPAMRAEERLVLALETLARHYGTKVG